MARTETTSSPNTIGGILAALDMIDGNAPMYMPEIMTYRGYYDRLGLDITDASLMTVEAVRDSLQTCIGKTFKGYKGGDFTMSADSLVHVADYGKTGEQVHGINVQPNLVSFATIDVGDN